MAKILRLDWIDFWLPFTGVLSKTNKCLACGLNIYVRTPVLNLIQRGRAAFYCDVCARDTYDALRADLELFEEGIRQRAKNNGHRLGEFKPGHLCNTEQGIFVAECLNCGPTVYYSVVDFIRNPVEAKDRPIVSDPYGFAMRHICMEQFRNDILIE